MHSKGQADRMFTPMSVFGSSDKGCYRTYRDNSSLTMAVCGLDSHVEARAAPSRMNGGMRLQSVASVRFALRGAQTGAEVARSSRRFREHAAAFRRRTLTAKSPARCRTPLSLPK